MHLSTLFSCLDEERPLATAATTTCELINSVTLSRLSPDRQSSLISEHRAAHLEHSSNSHRTDSFGLPRPSAEPGAPGAAATALTRRLERTRRGH